MFQFKAVTDAEIQELKNRIEIKKESVSSFGNKGSLRTLSNYTDQGMWHPCICYRFKSKFKINQIILPIKKTMGNQSQKYILPFKILFNWRESQCKDAFRRKEN